MWRTSCKCDGFQESLERHKGGHGPIVAGHPNTFLPPHAVSGGKTTQTCSFQRLGLNSSQPPTSKSFFCRRASRVRGFRGGGGGQAGPRQVGCLW